MDASDTAISIKLGVPADVQRKIEASVRRGRKSRGLAQKGGVALVEESESMQQIAMAIYNHGAENRVEMIFEGCEENDAEEGGEETGKNDFSYCMEFKIKYNKHSYSGRTMSAMKISGELENAIRGALNAMQFKSGIVSLERVKPDYDEISCMYNMSIYILPPPLPVVAPASRAKKAAATTAESAPNVESAESDDQQILVEIPSAKACIDFYVARADKWHEFGEDIRPLLGSAVDAPVTHAKKRARIN